MALSKTQIDRLGERLKSGSHTDEDLRLLDEYRRSFGEAYDMVIQAIRRSGAFPTERRAKSTQSIVEKLRRESLRLSQMQDIAGCRVVVQNIVEQDMQVGRLCVDFFPRIGTIADRREKPSHGYRAVHVIANVDEKLIEIQIRTELQHLWAEVSEKLSDVIDPSIKYGGGPRRWRDFLALSSESVALFEKSEEQFLEDLRVKEFQNYFQRVASETFEGPVESKSACDGPQAPQWNQEWRRWLEERRATIEKLLTGAINHASQLEEREP